MKITIRQPCVMVIFYILKKRFESVASTCVNQNYKDIYEIIKTPNVINPKAIFWVLLAVMGVNSFQRT
jgi:hypothetical protein